MNTATRFPYDGNTATLPKQDTQNARNYNGEKELVRSYVVVAMYKGEFREPITVRCWMGRSNSASTVYASIWVRTKDSKWLSGRGSAGGYGYDKISDAIDSAVSSAGIKMAKHFGGCGESPTRHALEAIARAAGYRKFTIVEG